MTLPLAGIRVLDLTWWIAGPVATMQMAMMGAEIIRLESENRPDSMRLTTPFAQNEPGVNRSGRWNSHNFSKRCATLNLSKPGAADLAKRLVAMSDIVFENFSSGVLDRMGLDYETLKQVNPRIILCSVSVVGRDGPLSKYVGFGGGAIAYSGLGSVTGHHGDPPGTVPPFIADYLTAWHAEMAMLSALHERERTGVGRRVEVSMVEATSSHLPEAFIDASMNGRVTGRHGNEHPTAAPHGYYPCAGTDRWLALSVDDDEQWRGLCRVLDGPSKVLSGDARFADGLLRHEHREELDAIVGTATRAFDPFELETQLQGACVPAGVSLRPPDVYDDPHLNARNVFIEPPHDETGPYKMVGLPWKIVGVEPVVASSPLLGADTQYVFGELLGLSADEISALHEAGVVA